MKPRSLRIFRKLEKVIGETFHEEIKKAEV